VTMDSIFQFLGQIIAIGGGAAAVAYLIFMFLGRKWIEAKFQERLERLKHEQEQQLEEFRYRANTLFSRVSKIHDKEIEILPEAWRLFQEAIGNLANVTSPLQSYPDLNFTTTEKVKEILEKSPLTEVEKKEILDAADKNDFYIKHVTWHEINKARAAIREFHNFMIFNRIFLTAELKEQFIKADTILYDALMKREVGERSKDVAMMHDAYKDISQGLTVIVDEIERIVQTRLNFNLAAPPDD